MAVKDSEKDLENNSIIKGIFGFGWAKNICSKNSQRKSRKGRYKCILSRNRNSKKNIIIKNLYKGIY